MSEQTDKPGIVTRALVYAYAILFFPAIILFIVSAVTGGEIFLNAPRWVGYGLMAIYSFMSIGTCFGYISFTLGLVTEFKEALKKSSETIIALLKRVFKEQTTPLGDGYSQSLLKLSESLFSSLGMLVVFVVFFLSPVFAMLFGPDFFKMSDFSVSNPTLSPGSIVILLFIAAASVNGFIAVVAWLLAAPSWNNAVLAFASQSERGHSIRSAGLALVPPAQIDTFETCMGEHDRQFRIDESPSGKASYYRYASKITLLIIQCHFIAAINRFRNIFTKDV